MYHNGLVARQYRLHHGDLGMFICLSQGESHSNHVFRWYIQAGLRPRHAPQKMCPQLCRRSCTCVRHGLQKGEYIKTPHKAALLGHVKVALIVKRLATPVAKKPILSVTHKILWPRSKRAVRGAKRPLPRVCRFAATYHSPKT